MDPIRAVEARGGTCAVSKALRPRASECGDGSRPDIDLANAIIAPVGNNFTVSGRPEPDHALCR